MLTAWFLGLAAADGQAASPAPLGQVGRLAYEAPSWWRIAALLAVLGLLLFVWWRVNRGKIGLGTLLKPGPQRLVLGEQRWINGRTLVCLVEVDGERFLLAQTQGAIAWQPLAKAPAPVPLR